LAVGRLHRTKGRIQILYSYGNHLEIKADGPAAEKGPRRPQGRRRAAPEPAATSVPAPTLPAAYAALSVNQRLVLYAPMAFEVLALVARESRNARARVSAARIILAYAAQDVPPVKRA
jgi:hypothetical protein